MREGLRSEAAPDAGLPISGAESFDLPRERSYQSPFDFSEQDVTRLRLHWETLLGGSWTIRNRAYWTELDWQSEGTLLNGVFPFFPGPDGLFVARTLVPLDDDQRWLGDELEVQLGGENAQLAVRRRGGGAQRRVHHRARSAPVHQPVQSGRDRDLAAATPFPASVRQGTPSGRSWRRT